MKVRTRLEPFLAPYALLIHALEIRRTIQSKCSLRAPCLPPIQAHTQSYLAAPSQIQLCVSSSPRLPVHNLMRDILAHRPTRCRKDGYSRRPRSAHCRERGSRGTSPVPLRTSRSFIFPVQSLQNKRVLSIDLAAIMAGSGIRGQFEEKFKALIKDIEDEARNVICFIDELRKFIAVSSRREAL